MIIRNVKIFRPDHQFVNGSIVVKDNTIVDVCYGDLWITSEKKVSDVDDHNETVIDGQGCYAIPGLIDIHFHGCVGVDFCDGTQAAIEKMAIYEASQGVTSICPATMTLAEEDIAKVCQAARGFVEASSESISKAASLCGINMEGPFISEAKKGAQNAKYIHKPDAAMFRRLQAQSGDLIKLVDVAPETEGAIDFIREVGDEVTVSLAHTAADYDIAREAFDAGAKHVTHLYNAMSPYTHRSPGVIGAACDDEKVMVELICDGVHIHPAVVRTTFKMFGDDRIILISDSMEVTGLGDGKGQLGGQRVFVKGNVATLADGTIAGSVTNLMNCLRTAVKTMHIPLESAVRCATENPARAIGIFDRVGSIEAGKSADIVLLNEQLEIKNIYLRGKAL